METLRAAFCFDQNLTAQVQVAVMSLLTAFAGEDVRLEIHCVCTEEACARVVGGPLAELMERVDETAKLVMHSVENLYAGAYEVRGISAGAYLRLLLHRVLPDIDKVLYLDVDILVRESLLPLWRTELGDHLLAAVKGPVNLADKWEWNSERPYWKLLAGMRGGYINSGVLLLNLAQIRRQQIDRQWEKLAEQKLYYQDQDILNITCRDRIIYLPPKYNSLAYLSAEDYRRMVTEDIFTEVESAQAQEQPAILHYAGDKPWKRYDTNQGFVWWDFVKKYPELYVLFDEGKARKYHGPTVLERVLRRVRRVLSKEKL